MTAALVAIFSLVLGVVCGLLFGRATNAPYQEAQELKDSLKTAQYELETYKSEVSQHFTKTAELVNEMTDNYRNVHSHLAAGAQTLTAGALQLESMNEKEALEAQAEVVSEAEPEIKEEAAAAEEATDTATQTADASDEGSETVAAADESATESASTDESSSETAEPIEVSADTVTAEATETTATAEEVPAELVAEAATTEQSQSEGRVH